MTRRYAIGNKRTVSADEMLWILGYMNDDELEHLYLAMLRLYRRG